MFFFVFFGKCFATEQKPLSTSHDLGMLCKRLLPSPARALPPMRLGRAGRLGSSKRNELGWARPCCTIKHCVCLVCIYVYIYTYIYMYILIYLFTRCGISNRNPNPHPNRNPILILILILIPVPSYNAKSYPILSYISYPILSYHMLSHHKGITTTRLRRDVAQG